MNYSTYMNKECDLIFECKTCEDCVEITIRDEDSENGVIETIHFHPDYFKIFNHCVNISVKVDEEERLLTMID